MRKISAWTVFIIALTAAVDGFAADYCWDVAAKEQGIAPELLMAISKVESDFNPNAINVNHGSVDHGHMQINTAWLPSLRAYGISRKQLFDPCTCTRAGAWILARNIYRYGYNWEAVGAYHAGEKNPVARREYAWKVYQALQQIKGKQPTRIAMK